MTDNYYATGRGGWGNVRKGDPSESHEQYNPATIPEKKTVSTGRGGAGNIREKGDHDDNAMAPSTSHNLLPVASPTIGRGGYGNVKAGQNSAAGLFAKAKDLFKKE